MIHQARFRCVPLRVNLGGLLGLKLLQKVGWHLAIVLLAVVLRLRLALAGLNAVLLGLLAVVLHGLVGEFLAASDESTALG